MLQKIQKLKSWKLGSVANPHVQRYEGHGGHKGYGRCEGYGASWGHSGCFPFPFVTHPAGAHQNSWSTITGFGSTHRVPLFKTRSAYPLKKNAAIPGGGHLLTKQGNLWTTPQAIESMTTRTPSGAFRRRRGEASGFQGQCRIGQRTRKDKPNKQTNTHTHTQAHTHIKMKKNRRHVCRASHVLAPDFR